MRPFSCYTCPNDSVAQWIERVSPEHKVAGSTPATVTTPTFTILLSPIFPTTLCLHPSIENKHTMGNKHTFLFFTILLSKNTYFCVLTCIVSSFMLSVKLKDGIGSIGGNIGLCKQNFQHRTTVG
jgi:hypothetical protein